VTASGGYASGALYPPATGKGALLPEDPVIVLRENRP